MQARRLFILSVEDNMELRSSSGNTKEGIDLPRRFRLRINSGDPGSMEPLSRGGTASGPSRSCAVPTPGPVPSSPGGGTRRAAKMVVLSVDHPDIREFIWCKAKEEDKALALREAGFNMSIDGEGFHSIQYQNANNSVRVNDEFMQAVENDADWYLIARSTGKPVGDPIPARQLMKEISQAAWRCPNGGFRVRLDDQSVAHLQDDGSNQRLQPVLRVRLPRRHRLQPRLAEPDALPLD